MFRTRLTAAAAVAALLAQPVAALAQAASPAPDAGATQAAAPDASATQVASALPVPEAEPGKPRGLSEGVVALVNDEIVSSYDLRERMLLLIATSGVQPTQENMPAIQQQALRSLVDEHLQMQELKKYDLKIPDADVDQDIADIAKENKLTAAQMVESLKQAGVDPKTLRDQIRARIGWDELVHGKFGTRAKVSDEEVQQTLQRIAESAAKPQYLVYEIYIDAQTVGGMDEAMNGARQLVDQIVKGAPFGAVARQFSNAPSAASGGEAGWIVSGEMEPNVEYALEKMHPGQLSMPIPSDKGVWIVYLRDKRAGGVTSIVHLAQAAVRVREDAPDTDVAAAKAKLESIAPKLTCENYAKLAKADGLTASDLGETDVNELAPDFKSAAETLKVGQVSAPIRTSAGLHVLLLCGKRAGGPNMPTKDQVENKLYNEQLSMLSQRYLRDLRNSATIETR